jgi:fermentation-respiration switch protein FrsA (DUF1100 family)
MFGHKPFLVLADHLTRRGVAVLRADGPGEGGPAPRPLTAALAREIAESALAGLAYLKARPEIDPARVGLIGQSVDGGIVGPMAAARPGGVAFLVLLGGGGLTGAETLPLTNDLLLQAGGAGEQVRAQKKRLNEVLCRIATDYADDGAAFKRFEEVWEKELAGLSEETRVPWGKAAVRAKFLELLSPWWRFYLAYDPRPALRKVTCPVLALHGEKDLEVPPKENLAKIARALQEGGNRDYTVKALPGLNHLFQTCKSGDASEYIETEETFAPAALAAVSGWVLRRFGTGSPAGPE